MAGLSNISFDPGLKFGNQIFQRFGCSVSPTPSQLSSSFKLVASFGRSAIRLNEDLVGLLLQSCLGGHSNDFHVKHLSGWMFSFQVSYKIWFLDQKPRFFFLPIVCYPLLPLGERWSKLA